LISKPQNPKTPKPQFRSRLLDKAILFPFNIIN
jgi:hypothetical protein